MNLREYIKQENLDRETEGLSGIIIYVFVTYFLVISVFVAIYVLLSKST